MNKTIFLAFLLVAIILTVGTFVVSGLSRRTKLLFFDSGCTHPFNPGNASTQGIIKANWVDRNILSVECYLRTYCGGAKIFGDYKLTGDALALKYKIRLGPVLTDCDCFRKLIYRLTNLRKREYRITLEEYK